MNSPRDQRGMGGASQIPPPPPVNFNERRRTVFSLKMPPVLSKWQDSWVGRWLPLSSLRLEQPERIKLMHPTHPFYMFCLLRHLHFGADDLGLQQGGSSQFPRHCFLGLWHWSGMILRPWEHNIKAKTSHCCADLTWERIGGAGVCRAPETLSRPSLLRAVVHMESCGVTHLLEAGISWRLPPQCPFFPSKPCLAVFPSSWVRWENCIVNWPQQLERAVMVGQARMLSCASHLTSLWAKRQVFRN